MQLLSILILINFISVIEGLNNFLLKLYCDERFSYLNEKFKIIYYTFFFTKIFNYSLEKYQSIMLQEIFNVIQYKFSNSSITISFCFISKSCKIGKNQRNVNKTVWWNCIHAAFMFTFINPCYMEGPSKFLCCVFKVSRYKRIDFIHRIKVAQYFPFNILKTCKFLNK